MPKSNAATLTDTVDARKARSTSGPETSVSIDWILAQTGPLVDGSVASLRFRENIESAGVSLVELEAWVLQALERPGDANSRHAFQDLVHAVAKRVGLKVQYGSYDRQSRGWLPFDGLWWLDSGSFACVQIHPERLEKMDVERMLGDLDGLHELGGIFTEAHGTLVCVLAAGYSADLEPAIRSHAAIHSIRLLGVDTLFDIARMRAEGVLSAGQVPVLFTPFDSVRLGQVVDFLERFVSRYDEEADEPSTYSTDSMAPASPDIPGSALRPAGELPLDAPRLRLLEPAVLPAADGLAAASPGPGAVPAGRPVALAPQMERRLRLETLKEVFALFKAGRYDDCLPLLERFVSAEENNPKAWEIYGDLSMKTGRHGEAIRAYSRVLGLGPPNRVLSFRLSGLYDTQGDLREAVRVLEDYARAVPQEAREVRLAIARTLARSNDYRSCLAVCDQLLRDGPWHREIVELRERCFRQLGGDTTAAQAKPAPSWPGGRFGIWLGELLGR